MSNDGNIVIANLYGRGPTGLPVPLALGPGGGIAGGMITVADWQAAPIETAVLTPLLAYAPLGDEASAILFGMRVESDSAVGATFVVEASEDGVKPIKSLSYSFVLAPGEHDAFVTAVPVMFRYWRFAFTPDGGIAKVSSIVRKLPR